MKAVVLVAGKGTRMAKDYEGPKHLLPLNGKPVVEHALDQLPAEVDSLIMVVGGPHEQKIRDYFKSNEYDGRPIEFVRQEQQLGLAHAFRTAQHLITGRWLGMVGDDVFGPLGLQGLVKEELAVLASRVEQPETFGVLVTDDQNNLVRSVEKPKEFISNLVWTGAMVMDESFFTAKTEPSARGEYETPDVWMKMINDLGKKIKVVEADFWLPINDKPQLEEAERILAGRS